MELEYKFVCESIEALEQLARLDAVAGCRLSPAKTGEVRDVYFDTAAFALLKAGYGARVRHAGAERRLTVKGIGGSTEGGLHAREEIETRLTPVPEDDLAAARAALPESLRATVGEAAIQELFTVQNVRIVREGRSRDGGRFELALDRATFRGPRGESSRCEVEVEAVSMSEAALREVAEALRQAFLLRPEPESKYHFGLRTVVRSREPRDTR